MSPSFQDDQRITPWSYLLQFAFSNLPLFGLAFLGILLDEMDAVFLFVIIFIIEGVVILILYHYFYLSFEVHDDWVFVQLSLGHRGPRHIPLKEIESIELMDLSILERRLSIPKRGCFETHEEWQYLVAGGEGVRIKRADKNVIVGMRNPDDFITAVRTAMDRQ